MDVAARCVSRFLLSLFLLTNFLMQIHQLPSTILFFSSMGPTERRHCVSPARPPAHLHSSLLRCTFRQLFQFPFDL